MFRSQFNTDNLPPIIGLSFLGVPVLIIAGCDPLQDIYVNKNQFNTKHPDGARMWAKLMPKSLLFMQTKDQTYAQKRKIVTGAFFKQKLIDMTKTIRECILDQVRNL